MKIDINKITVVQQNQVYGVIEWKSHKYPNKVYRAQCFSPEMYFHAWCLVIGITDYHTVITSHYLKH